MAQSPEYQRIKQQPRIKAVTVKRKRTKYTLIIFLVALGTWSAKQVVNS